MPEDEHEFALNVSLDGVFQGRPFHPEEETIEAVGEALRLKDEDPHALVTIVVTRNFPRPGVDNLD